MPLVEFGSRPLGFSLGSVEDPHPDPHNFDGLDPNPDPHPMKMPIRIKMISWIRIRILIDLQMISQNVWNMILF
jgi:hypothetical protein